MKRDYTRPVIKALEKGTSAASPETTIFSTFIPPSRRSWIYLRCIISHAGPGKAELFLQKAT